MAVIVKKDQGKPDTGTDKLVEGPILLAPVKGSKPQAGTEDLDGWREIESASDVNGWILENIYEKVISSFRICPEQDPRVAEAEAKAWGRYLSATRKGNGQELMYNQFFRYEFYEGRKRTGFWGNIEEAIRRIGLGENPKITIFSAGVGRDLLKVGLASGLWGSSAPRGIAGTYKEISPEYFSLLKPGARIMVTEYERHALGALENMVDGLLQRDLLREEMITCRRWDFRYRAPLASNTQDLVVLSLVGNYARREEQPFILREMARCVAKGGHLVVSTMLPGLDFSKSHQGLRKIKIILSSPLMWPILPEALPWQVNWGRMAGEMNKAGYWQNIPAKEWAKFLEPAGMRTVKIYSAPSSLLPVEVLVAQKE